MQIDGFTTEKCIWSCKPSNICPRLIDDRSITCTIQASIHPSYIFFSVNETFEKYQKVKPLVVMVNRNIWIADGGINHKCTAWVSSWAPGDRIMDSSIAVSHLLKHMLPFLLSGNVALSTAIKEHYKYEDGSLVLLSFYLLWWSPVTLNSLHWICARPGNMASNVAFGNKRNYLIFKVSHIG